MAKWAAVIVRFQIVTGSRLRGTIAPVFQIDQNIALGRFLLDEVRPLASEPQRAWMERVGRWVKANPDESAARALIRRRAADGGIAIGWLLAWAMNGFQRVVVGHKLAASLMATHAGDDPDVMTCRPWNAYTIEIPSGLVQVDALGVTTSFDIACVWHHPPDAMSYYAIFSRDSDFAVSGKLVFPLPDFNTSLEHLGASDTVMLRARECFARLVVGTELEMTDPSRVKAPTSATRARVDSNAPSGVHRLVREVKVDCRATIAGYISGQRRGSPTVQTLVRGHFKRVAHGAARADRKWIHIEPYWRGPEDAPIAVRPHRMSDAD
jgi:hypothetical protein